MNVSLCRTSIRFPLESTIELELSIPADEVVLPKARAITAAAPTTPIRDLFPTAPPQTREVLTTNTIHSVVVSDAYPTTFEVGIRRGCRNEFDGKLFRNTRVAASPNGLHRMVVGLATNGGSGTQGRERITPRNNLIEEHSE